MLSYDAFGLTIQANVPLPGLSARPGPAIRPAISIQLGSLPAELNRSDARPIFVTPGLTLLQAGRHTLFDYADGTCFAVREDGLAVWGTWPTNLTLEDAATYLLGPVMAFVLRRHGRFALHAGAFASGGAAVAIAGGPQAGKSTLLGALALGGALVLTDDVAPLRDDGERVLVDPSYPFVRLWEDSVIRLFGDPAALPRLTPNWEKRYLDVGRRGLFESRALPLAAIFVLGDRDAERAPRVEPLTGRDAFTAVLAHLHTVWMLPSAPQRAAFELATRIAARVPLLRLVPHRDPARTEALCELVLATVDRLQPSDTLDVPAR